MKINSFMTITQAWGYLVPGKAENFYQAAKVTGNYSVLDYAIKILSFRNNVYIGAGLAVAGGLGAAVSIRELWKSIESTNPEDKCGAMYIRCVVLTSVVGGAGAIFAGINFVSLKRVFA